MRIVEKFNHCQHVADYYWLKYTGNNITSTYFMYFRIWRKYNLMAGN